MSNVFRRRETIRNVSAELEDSMKILRELELHLKFFNISFGNVLWGCKVFYLSLTILSGFSAIRLIHTNPDFGFLYTYICFLCSALFIGMFQFAYKVTEALENLRKWMEILSVDLVNVEERKYWAGVFKSIPRMGMSLGIFNRVEREAVPIFIDFCLKQIVSLLLAFK